MSNNQDTVSSKDWLVLLSIAAVFYLFVWWLAGGRENAFMQIDSLDYLHLGAKLFSEGVFDSLFRTPVYPAFAGFWTEFIGLSTEQFVLVQIVFALFNIVLLGRLAGYFVNAKWQKVIVLVFALDLVTVQVANWVLSETLFSFLLLLSLNLFLEIHIRENKGIWLAVLCGISFGLFALCRPVGQYLLFLLILWFLFKPSNNFSLKAKLLSAILIVLMHSLIFSAWKYHNYLKTGHSFVSTTISYNMYNYRAAWNVAYRDGRTFEDVKDEMFEERANFKRSNPQLSEYEVSKEITKRGLDIILSTPKETFFQAVRGIVYLYGGLYNGSLQRIFVDNISVRLAQIYTLIYWALIYLGVLFAIWYYRKLSEIEQQFFILCTAVVAYFTFFSIGVESYARLRAPFAPYLVAVSILGWNKLLSKKKS